MHHAMCCDTCLMVAWWLRVQLPAATMPTLVCLAQSKSRWSCNSQASDPPEYQRRREGLLTLCARALLRVSTRRHPPSVSCEGAATDLSSGVVGRLLDADLASVWLRAEAGPLPFESPFSSLPSAQSPQWCWSSSGEHLLQHALPTTPVEPGSPEVRVQNRV